jgi:hypothetical protein
MQGNEKSARYDKEVGVYMKHLREKVKWTTRHGQMLKY